MLNKYKAKIVSIIHRHLPGCKIYLFGIKTKEKNDELELQIALDTGDVINPGVIGNIYAELKEELFNVDVDIVDINKSSEEARAKILKKGVHW